MKNITSYAVSGTLLTLVLLSSTALSAKTVWLDADDYRVVAQGDAETVPTDFAVTPEDIADTAAELEKASQNIQKESADESDMLTLTAEGGFLLPTYVLPEVVPQPTPTQATNGDAANPWRTDNVEKADAVLKMAAKPDSAEDDKLLQTIEKQYADTTALLTETAKRLESLEMGVQDLKTANMKMADVEPAETVRRQPLLLPLAPIKKEAVVVSEPADEVAELAPQKSDYIDYVLSVLKRVESEPVTYTETDEMVIKTIPQEIKLNFLPNSVDISGQSFKWVKAFVYNPKKSVQKAVEVRMSGNNLDLQSRRFALIKGALLNYGLAPRQIRFVLTDRNPNTIVLRTITLPEEQEVFYNRNSNGKVTQQIIRKW